MLRCTRKGWERILSGQGPLKRFWRLGEVIRQLLKSRLWHSSAFQPYLDLWREEAQAMAPIVIEASGDENWLRKLMRTMMHRGIAR